MNGQCRDLYACLIAGHEFFAALVEERRIDVDVECPEAQVLTHISAARRITQPHHVGHRACLQEAQGAKADLLHAHSRRRASRT